MQFSTEWMRPSPRVFPPGNCSALNFQPGCGGQLDLEVAIWKPNSHLLVSRDLQIQQFLRWFQSQPQMKKPPANEFEPFPAPPAACSCINCPILLWNTPGYCLIEVCLCIHPTYYGHFRLQDYCTTSVIGAVSVMPSGKLVTLNQTAHILSLYLEMFWSKMPMATTGWHSCTSPHNSSPDSSPRAILLFHGPHSAMVQRTCVITPASHTSLIKVIISFVPRYAILFRINNLYALKQFHRFH